MTPRNRLESIKKRLVKTSLSLKVVVSSVNLWRFLFSKVCLFFSFSDRLSLSGGNAQGQGREGSRPRAGSLSREQAALPDDPERGPRDHRLNWLNKWREREDAAVLSLVAIGLIFFPLPSWAGRLRHRPGLRATTCQILPEFVFKKWNDDDDDQGSVIFEVIRGFF